MKRIGAFLILVSLFFGTVLINSCKKDKVIPTLTTTAVTNITVNSATSGGLISKDGGAAVTARGVCWGTSASPTISGAHTTDDRGTGSFTSNITDLTSNTLYHVRAYATNSVGTAYGDEVTFTTTPIVIATLTTTDVSAITLTTAVSGGNITADGNGTITARGVCWATTSAPTITNSLTTDGTGTGTFTSNLSGLLPATTYYVRAYATNSAGTAYGNEVSFTTTAIVVPTLTTTAATSITLTTAVSGGNITADGGGAVTARGTCWATAANPTITDSKTTDGTGTGTFTSNLTGLLPGITYHMRAYATNSAGTAYGNDLSFTTTAIVVPTLTTTAATSIAITTAVSGGNITADGGGAVTARGACWSTAANPTITDSKTTDGAGTGSFTSNLTGLSAGTTYHVRAYATNSAGTAYGNDLSFTTTATTPTLTTTAVTSITLTTAVSGGTITSNGGALITVSGVCWGASANPTTAGSHSTDGTATGSFTSNITGLSGGTTYHVRAYATNSAGTAYGNDLSFTTSVTVPTLTTAAITSITLTTAVSGGTITSNGGALITVSGICWGTSANPTTAGSHSTDGTTTGSFTSNMTGLLAGTTYHVRAYATNSAGTGYGNDLSFTTTAAVAPTLTTNAVTSIATTTAVSGGTITSNGGALITVSGICWSTSVTPTVAGSHSTDGTTTGSFSSTMTGLSSGTTYYVRAYATNSVGTAYGNQLSFATLHETGTLNDNDGNTYNTVKIGTQWWMAENLKTTKLSDVPGTPITNITDATAWTTTVTAAYSWYDNDAGNKTEYGALYNWFTVNTGNLCPTGWHVPTDGEYNTLEMYLGIAPADVDLYGWRGTDQGSQMKNTTGWTTLSGTNTSGFTAKPSGYRYFLSGTFNNLGSLAYYWTATQDASTTAWYRLLDGSRNDVYKGVVEKQAGKAVRCVMN